jgi:hypothetical protein
MDRATRQAESMTGDALAERDACREALRDYHRRRMANVGDTSIISELAGLIEQAKAAGLGLAEIAALTTGEARCRVPGPSSTGPARSTAGHTGYGRPSTAAR